jgi:hypothetical protein
VSDSSEAIWRRVAAAVAITGSSAALALAAPVSASAALVPETAPTSFVEGPSWKCLREWGDATLGTAFFVGGGMAAIASAPTTGPFGIAFGSASILWGALKLPDEFSDVRDSC